MNFAGRELDLQQAHIMAVLNITPDSFSDGGQLFAQDGVDWDQLYRRAEAAIQAGATILDIGGESTRPGAEPVPLAQELARVVPVIEGLHRRFDAVISVDTSAPTLMREAATAGAGLINDVRALSREGALEAAASTGLPVCLMHMQGQPGTMQQAPQYDDVLGSVLSALTQRIENYVLAGGNQSNVILDPGFGFGKTFEHNVALFKGLPQLAAAGFPLLVGVSRKTMIGHIVDKPPAERAVASAMAAALAVKNGAKIVRVHDVQATSDALKVMNSLGT